MIKVLGEHYYFDLDKIEEYLDMSDKSTEKKSIDEKSTEEKSTEEKSIDENELSLSETKINIIKFEMVKMLMDTVLTENEDTDEKLGSKSSSNTSIPFRLAFNSLLNKKLINYY